MTGGGTRERLDDVRELGNISTGRLAAAVAQNSLRRGHATTLFWPVDRGTPRGLGEENCVRYRTTAELGERLLHPAATPPQVLVHAAAVADYRPVVQSGKVSSDAPSWTVELQRVPKLVDGFRDRFADACIVLFKLESGVDEAELRRRASLAAQRVRARFVFANRVEEVGDRHRGWLWDAVGDGWTAAEGRDAIARCVMDAVECAQEGGP